MIFNDFYYIISHMASEKRLINISYTEKEPETVSNAERFPFWVKKVGYTTERRTAFGESGHFTDYVMIYTLSGVVQCLQANRIEYLRSGDILIASCNAPIRLNQVSRSKWEYMYLVYNGDHAKFLYNMIRTKNNVFRVNPPSTMVNLMMQLIAVNYDDSSYSNMQASALVHQALMTLYTSSQEILKAKSMIPVQDSHVNAAINYITENYKKELTVDAICSKVGFTKYYFCRIFKEITGETIHNFVNQFRINKAKDLLTYSKLSVTAISADVGYSNLVTFSRLFKKETGMTPGEYRRNF